MSRFERQFPAMCPRLGAYVFAFGFLVSLLNVVLAFRAQASGRRQSVRRGRFFGARARLPSGRALRGSVGTYPEWRLFALDQKRFLGARDSYVGN
jgi:hypothetical protein